MNILVRINKILGYLRYSVSKTLFLLDLFVGLIKCFSVSFYLLFLGLSSSFYSLCVFLSKIILHSSKNKSEITSSGATNNASDVRYEHIIFMLVFFVVIPLSITVSSLYLYYRQLLSFFLCFKFVFLIVFPLSVQAEETSLLWRFFS